MIKLDLQTGYMKALGNVKLMVKTVLREHYQKLQQECSVHQFKSNLNLIKSIFIIWI